MFKVSLSSDVNGGKLQTFSSVSNGKTDPTHKRFYFCYFSFVTFIIMEMTLNLTLMATVKQRLGVVLDDKHPKEKQC